MASEETETGESTLVNTNLTRIEKELEAKLVQLSLTLKRTEKVLASGKRETIKRHVEALQSVNSSTNQCKRLVEEQKIASKVNIDLISDWNDDLESRFEDADAQISLLDKWLAENERQSRVETEAEMFRRELKLHEEKLRMENEMSASKSEMREFSQLNAKLPKLVISKFEGSFMDWPRFWGQFSEAIDKSSIAAITKFTYLLELLSPKVKICVESLPFSAEGYNRAKSILQDKYGKESEIVKCYVKEILELPHISCNNPRKIADFSEKLTYCVRALETLKKLDEINGNVSMTLEKLSGIRGDLVRTDPDWESWSFGQLSEALRQWVKRNPVVNNDSRYEGNRTHKVFHARQNERNYPAAFIAVIWIIKLKSATK